MENNRKKKDSRKMKTQNVKQITIRFRSNTERYTIPEYHINVDGSMTAVELNTLVNNLMKDSMDVEGQVEFDFVICSQFLRTSLIEHITEMDISTEEIVVDCLEKHTPPEPKDCLIQDDWISTIALCGKWILTGSYDNTLRIWDLENHAQRLVISAHARPVKAVAWISLDDEEAVFVSTSMGNDCMIWNWKIAENSANCVSVCKGHEGTVDTVSLNHDKTLMATGSWDKMLYIWSASTQGEDEAGEPASKRSRGSHVNRTKTPLRAMKGHTHAVSGVVWSKKSEVITCSWDHTMKVWDTEMGHKKQEIHAENSIFSVDYSPLSNMLLTGSADGFVRLYDPRSTEGAIMKTKFTSHKQWVAKVCWSTVDEHLFISGSYDSVVKMWDTRSSKTALYDLVGHKDKILSLDWTNPEVILSGGADNTLRIFSTPGN
ncbi:hypothetical protein DMN91_001090 [Ooceraea biroi]|uniref:Ribosome biogenesis protein WDR12 homolog n=1 Tax=Ooceraea biroi TaxID=2015173 RepID=A0A3L8E534_OOCBI|nr:ribosome biogenesis protein WDR12 homolog isoform X1 [Ooceraea biroi]XP_011346839.2 ribosome biogenesis protein WDR12 homolog isoform X1 [Ooceraea biroi]RLU27289.1 hypothetical protein DMN91_001090 [Ooceraea biroi]